MSTWFLQWPRCCEARKKIPRPLRRLGPAQWNAVYLHGAPGCFARACNSETKGTGDQSMWRWNYGGIMMLRLWNGSPYPLHWCVAALPNRTAISNIWQCLIMGCTPGYGNFNRLNWWHQTWPYFPRKPIERTVLADKVWESHKPARSVVPRRQGGQGKAPASSSAAAAGAMGVGTASVTIRGLEDSGMVKMCAWTCQKPSPPGCFYILPREGSLSLGSCQNVGHIWMGQCVWYHF